MASNKSCKWCSYYMFTGHMCQKTGFCTEGEEKEFGTVCKFFDLDEDLKKEYDK